MRPSPGERAPGERPPPPIVDTHCHLDCPEFDPDRRAVLAHARTAGVVGLVIPAIERASWGGLLNLCRANPDCFPALGLHPVYLDRHGDGDLPALEQALGQHPVIAVGEIGLDFFADGLDRARQQRLFAEQLACARAANLPVILHVRKAHAQVLAALKATPVRGGIVHAFSGGIEEARRYLDLGFKLGFGGMLTFERSTKLRRLAAGLPLDALVLETDAPDLTVAAHRGSRNSPEYLPDVLQALAQVRGEDPSGIAAATTANARAVLGLRLPAAAVGTTH
jgi:TatD DNase family protein